MLIIRCTDLLGPEAFSLCNAMRAAGRTIHLSSCDGSYKSYVEIMARAGHLQTLGYGTVQ